MNGEGNAKDDLLVEVFKNGASTQRSRFGSTRGEITKTWTFGDVRAQSEAIYMTNKILRGHASSQVGLPVRIFDVSA